MGWRVCFFGFSRPPAKDVLEKAEWLTSWRLFHEPETEAWFLEGQSESDEITFELVERFVDRGLPDRGVEVDVEIRVGHRPVTHVRSGP